jgi:hypothetical protein
MVVSSQSKQIVRKTLSQKNTTTKKGLVQGFKVFAHSSSPVPPPQ